jgi:hypothetical protein
MISYVYEAKEGFLIAANEDIDVPAGFGTVDSSRTPGLPTA